jgi:hypothetical protein
MKYHFCMGENLWPNVVPKSSTLKNRNKNQHSKVEWVFKGEEDIRSFQSATIN